MTWSLYEVEAPKSKCNSQVQSLPFHHFPFNKKESNARLRNIRMQMCGVLQKYANILLLVVHSQLLISAVFLWFRIVNTHK